MQKEAFHSVAKIFTLSSCKVPQQAKEQLKDFSSIKTAFFQLQSNCTLRTDDKNAELIIIKKLYECITFQLQGFISTNELHLFYFLLDLSPRLEGKVIFMAELEHQLIITMQFCVVQKIDSTKKKGGGGKILFHYTTGHVSSTIEHETKKKIFFVFVPSVYADRDPILSRPDRDNVQPHQHMLPSLYSLISVLTGSHPYNRWS